MGELGCYGGGIVRGAETRRTDPFAREGLQLWHYVAEPQCTPSRSALMTGRHAIRSGTHTVPRDGGSQGFVAWERTIADVLSEAGYATACFGKWHLGAEDGRWATDHGFDEWYGPPRSYDEAAGTTTPGTGRIAICGRTCTRGRATAASGSSTTSRSRWSAGATSTSSSSGARSRS